MKYTKPELLAFAPALAIVQGMTKDTSNVPDVPTDGRVHSLPAYEADE
ncbi:MAG TPA: hypothetical protein VFN26_05995 [Candidatus Acidoferrum sp.]|nr:hypothetical protein [Candidatus Acidoferrum sp.]